VSTKAPLGADYFEFVTELKARIRSARVSAARSVNRELILLYWDIGQGIVGRQAQLGWGEAVVETLSRDLRAAFPHANGFSARNLRDMKRLYLAYSSPEFWRQAVAKIGTPPKRVASGGLRRQLAANMTGPRQQNDLVRQTLADVPWGHHLLILNKTEPAEQRLYYLQATARFGWSRGVLLNQIKADAHGRSLAEGKAHNFPAALPEHLAEQAEEALKSRYNLEFLGIGRAVRERELEGRLIERLRDFILELGYGFCFIGRQHRLVLGRKEYFIDLLFYHRFLKALVAIELKLGAFEPAFAGKMDFYLNLLNAKDRGPGDAPSIGIILCAEKDNLEVEFSLKSKANPIGVAEYQLQAKLPPELKGKLPSRKQLQDLVRQVLPVVVESPIHDGRQ